MLVSSSSLLEDAVYSWPPHMTVCCCLCVQFQDVLCAVHPRWVDVRKAVMLDGKLVSAMEVWLEARVVAEVVRPTMLSQIMP